MQPRVPDPINSAYRLHTVIPRHGQALLAELEKASSGDKKLTEWRTNQIRNFISAICVYAEDLSDRYKSRRIDAVAQTVRNLMEICIWTQYCNLSEQHAKTFYDDSFRDLREMLEAISALYASSNGKPDERLVKMLGGLRDVATKSGFQDIDEGYKRVSAAAKEVGRGNAFYALYKVASKLAHPTSMALNLGEGLVKLLDSQYVGGEEFASACLAEIEKFLKTVVP